jgi:type II secretory pathway pseudopilin PulG
MARTKRGLSGFTLVELLGVVTIVLVFSMLVMNTNRNATNSAQNITAQQQMTQLQTAVETWISSKPSMHEATTEWTTKGGNAGALIGWNDGPMSMLPEQTRIQFTSYGDKLVTPVSQAQQLGFSVVWDEAENRVQGPVVILSNL